MKLATLAGTDFKEATSEMTAALRGFHMEMDEGERITDVYSELAAKAAADVQGIATAISKTASIANSAGMEFETTAALLTQMIETTQESPENLGTAMKTVIARFTELKNNVSATESEFDDLDYNKVDIALKSVGIQLKDTNGQFRDLDDVFLELSSKWNTLDRNSQRYIATIAAGSRQQSRFIAMMENYERTMELVDTAYDSAGRSSVQFAKYSDSIEYKIKQLSNTWEQFRTGFFSEEFYGGVLEKVNELLSKLSNMSGFEGSQFVVTGAIIGSSLVNGIIKSLKEGIGNAHSLKQELANLIDNKVQEKREDRIGRKIEVQLELQKQSIEKVTNESKQAVKQIQARIAQEKKNQIDLNLDITKGNGEKTSFFKQLERNSNRNPKLKQYKDILKGSFTGADATKQQAEYQILNATEQEWEKYISTIQSVSQIQGINEKETQNVVNELNRQRDAVKNLTEQEKEEIRVERERRDQQIQNITDNTSGKINKLQGKKESSRISMGDAMSQAGSVLGQSLTMGISAAISGADLESAINTAIIPAVMGGTNLLMQSASNGMKALTAKLAGDAAAAGTAAGAALTAGIALAVVGIAVAIAKVVQLAIKTKKESDEYYQAQQRYENAEAALEKYNKKLDESNQEYDKAKDNYDKVKEAANTYDELTNKIFLTTEEEQELIDAQNTLAEQSDDMIQNYDSQGNAIVSLTDKINILKEAEEELIEKNQESLKAEIQASRGQIDLSNAEKDKAQATAEQLNTEDSKKLIGLLENSKWDVADTGIFEAENYLNDLMKNQGIEALILDTLKENGYNDNVTQSRKSLIDFLNEGNRETEQENWEKVRAIILPALKKAANPDTEDLDKDISKAEDTIIKDYEQLYNADLIKDQDFQKLNKTTRDIYSRIVQNSIKANYETWKSIAEEEGYDVDEYIESQIKGNLALSTIKNNFKNLTPLQQEQIEQYQNQFTELTKTERESLLGKIEDINGDIYEILNKDTNEYINKTKDYIGQLKEVLGESEESRKFVDFFEQLGFDAQAALINGLGEQQNPETYLKSYQIAVESLQGKLIADYSFNPNDAARITNDFISFDYINASGEQLSSRRTSFIDSLIKENKINEKEAEELYDSTIKDLSKFLRGAILKTADQAEQSFNTFIEKMKDLNSKSKEILSAFKEIGREGGLTTDSAYSLVSMGYGEYLTPTNNGMISLDYSTIIDKQMQERIQGMRTLEEEYQQTYREFLHKRVGSDEYIQGLEALKVQREGIRQSLLLAQSEISTLKKELQDMESDAEDSAKKARKSYEKAIKDLEKAKKELDDFINGDPYYNGSLDQLYNYSGQIELLDKDIDSLSKKLESVKSKAEAKPLIDQLLGTMTDKNAYNKAKMNVLKSGMDDILDTLNREFSGGFKLTDSGFLEVTDGIFGINQKISDELQKQIQAYNDARKQYLDIETTVALQEQELLKQWNGYLQNYISLQDEVSNVLQENAEKQVEITQNKYDALKEADDDYISALEKAIEKQRKLRDKENDFEKLAQKQKQLSLMQRDTSGANKKEVNSLQEEIKDTQQNLLDSSIDEVIDSLKELYELQAEAREEEIEYLEAVKENTVYWKEANEIIAGFGNSEDLINWMYKNNTKLADKSVEELETYANEMEELYAGAAIYLSSSKDDFLNTLTITEEETNRIVNETFETMTGAAQKSVSEVKESVAEELAQLQEAYNEAVQTANDAYQNWVTADQQWKDTITGVEDAMKSSTLQMTNFLDILESTLSSGGDEIFKQYVDLLKDMAGVSNAEELMARGIITQEQLDRYQNYGSEQWIANYGAGGQYAYNSSSKISSFIQPGGSRYFLQDVRLPNGEIMSASDFLSSQGKIDYSATQYAPPKTNNSNSNLVKLKEDQYFINVESDWPIAYKMGASGIITAENLGKLMELIVQYRKMGLIPENSINIYKSGSDQIQRQFKKGGLVDYTGPAWVDGTPSEPESFLSAEDTKRIGDAARILEGLEFLTNTESSKTVTTTNIGDTSVQVYINVESISDDYDVDRLAERVKKDIVDASKQIGNSVILTK